MTRYVVGFGNWSMGDDSIGLRVVEEIINRNLDTDFETVLLPDSGFNLVHCFQKETQSILIVDAVKVGKKPGEHIFFRPEEVQTQKKLDRISTHEGDVLKIIELGKQLDYPIPPITIMGIEPASMKLGEGLSPEIEKSLETYLKAVVHFCRDKVTPNLIPTN